jgi:hypothetical protein
MIVYNIKFSVRDMSVHICYKNVINYKYNYHCVSGFSTKYYYYDCCFYDLNGKTIVEIRKELNN